MAMLTPFDLYKPPPNDGLDDEDDDPTIAGSAAAAAAGIGGGKNVLPVSGNPKTMNINPLILTNITGSPYYKQTLVNIKTYHEIIDEIYYKVGHLEPWEKGSRKTAGQTGMCGGVRGVGAGGIVSSAYCILFRLGTLKLTRKQAIGLLNHADSPYIRGIGFMFLRYSQPPADLWNWFEPYLEDEEEIDIKAGGGKTMTIGEMVKSMLEKLEWFDTRFPRIPVNIQKQISEKLSEYFPKANVRGVNNDYIEKNTRDRERSEERGRDRERSREKSSRNRSRERSHHKKSRDRSRERSRDRSRERSRERSRDRSRKHRSRERKRSRDRRSRSRSKDRKRRSRSRNRDKKKSKHKKRSRSRDRKKHKRRDHSPNSYEDELKNYKEHRSKVKKHKRSRSRSR